MHAFKNPRFAGTLFGLVIISVLAAGLHAAQGNARAQPQAATPFSIQYIEGTPQQKEMAKSPAVITQGGRVIWLAGQSGGGTPGNFAAQAKSVFDRMQMTLKQSNADLKDLVSLKVFIKADPANSADVVKLLKEIFPDGKYPASTVVTVAYAGSLIEIQGIAVVAN